MAQTGISGSSELGRNVIMGGQSATSGHLKIGDFSTIAARGGVSKFRRRACLWRFSYHASKDWLKLQAKIAIILKKNHKINIASP